VQSIVERQIQLQTVAHVDQVIIYQTEQDLLDLLTILQPAVRFLGEEYRDRDFTGRQWCLDNGVELYYNSRKHRFSTTDLRKRTAAATVK
jgi:glycerol-3-phosphate cytidylyltransferase